MEDQAVIIIHYGGNIFGGEAAENLDEGGLWQVLLETIEDSYISINSVTVYEKSAAKRISFQFRRLTALNIS